MKNKKILFISSSGGHLSELMQLKKMFTKYEYHIVTEKNDSTKNLKNEYKERISYLVYGTKKNPFKYLFVCIINFIKSFLIFIKQKPDVIVTTGAHTAVIMCYIAKLFRKRVIFIETFANINTKTLAGRLVYPIADTFVVQWEEMKKLYPKAEYWGWIY